MSRQVVCTALPRAAGLILHSLLWEHVAFTFIGEEEEEEEEVVRAAVEEKYSSDDNEEEEEEEEEE